MEFKNIFVKLTTNDVIQLPLNQNMKHVTIDPKALQNADATLLCYRIHSMKTKDEKFAYLFKNVNPTGTWYNMNVRDGDRLITLNGEDVSRLPYKTLHSLMIDKGIPLTCEIIWHPELFIDLREWYLLLELLEANKKTIETVSDLDLIDMNIDGNSCSLQENSSISQTSLVASNNSTEGLQKKDVININIRAHLTNIIRYLLDYQPRRPFELCNGLLKKSYEQEPNPSTHSSNDVYTFAQREFNFLSNSSTIQGNPEEIMTNILELDFLFEQIGVGLNKDEMFRIWLLMKDLLKEDVTIQQLRFWGKIFGIRNNYYVVEADFDMFDNIDLNDSEFTKYQSIFTSEEENENDDDDVDTHFQSKVPTEPVGNGVNQKIFYVSTGTDQPFVQLPLVTPEQIQISRRIQWFFTGDLEAPVLSHGGFPGVEKHLLRAQIQRITAGSQIAPKNYFRISIHENEEQEYEEETIDEQSNAHRIRFDINTEYEGNTLENLSSPSGEYWVHCVAFIYKQGRNVYFHHDDENANNRTLLIEHRPHLLSSIHEDASISGFYPAWSIGRASTIVPEHTLVYVRSNRWPGAFAIADRYRFKNIYIGWGVKNTHENCQPTMIDDLPENEYASSFMEIDDPTNEQDELFQSFALLSPQENEQSEHDVE